MSDAEYIEEPEEFEVPVLTERELPEYHTILEIWREVLRPARAEAVAPITPGWANRVVGSYTEIHYADMPDYQRVYFDRLIVLLEIVEKVVEDDPDSITWVTPEEDVEHNAQHYRDILRDWQVEFIQWEMNWNPTSPHAAVEIAASGEIHKVFFGPTGLTAFLDNIKFSEVYTDQDVANLAEVLNQVKAGR